MKNQKFCFIFAVIIAGIMFVSCNKGDNLVEIETSTSTMDDIVSLQNLYEDLQTNSIESLTNYLEERIKDRSLAPQPIQSELRSANLNTPVNQQIIKKEYVEPYFVENTFNEVSTIEYKGNFDFQALINDSRLSLDDREMILFAHANIEYILSYEMMEPLGPIGLQAAYCLEKYRWELFQIANYYFIVNFLTIAPIISDYMASQWNEMLGMKLVSNNHYKDIADSEERYKSCLGR